MTSYPPPRVIVFDVNETLSDLTPLADCFAELGAPTHLADLWFTAILRDGFALAAAGSTAPFATLGASLLRRLLVDVRLSMDLDSAVQQIMTSFQSLPLHDDAGLGIAALAEQELRLTTLSNGPTAVAHTLLERNGLRKHFEMLLSAEAVGLWKPAHAAYRYAAEMVQVPASQLMLVASHPWDVHGAARAGLSTAWVNRTGAAYPEYLTPSNEHVTSILELAERLRPGIAGPASADSVDAKWSPTEDARQQGRTAGPAGSG